MSSCFERGRAFLVAVALSIATSCGGGASSDAPDASTGTTGTGGGLPSDATLFDGELALCVADGPLGVPRAGCPNDFPDDSDCATASPFYADVAPIFAKRCTICHGAGGLETKFSFGTYAQIHDNSVTRADVLTQVYSCRMPPACAPNLDADERRTMLKWFACGFLEAPGRGGDASPADAPGDAPAESGD